MHEDITRSIRILTARTDAYRRFLIMNRLTEKLKTAGAIVGRQTAKIEARADSLIAREADIEARTDKAFSPHEAVLDDAARGLDSMERQLALLSNDPLPGSGEPQESHPGGSGASTEPSQTSGAASSYFQEKPHG